MERTQKEKELYYHALHTIFTRENEDKAVAVKAIRILNTDGTQSIRLHVDVDGQLDEPFEFKMDELRTKIMKVNNYSAHFTGLEIQDIIGGVRKFDAQESIVLINDNRLGWKIDKDGAYCGWLGAICYDMQGIHKVKDTENKNNVLSARGNLDENLSYIKEYLGKHEIPQAVFLYGIGAILAGYMNKTLLLNLSGKSSRGKTTLAKLIISLFAEPENERLCKTFNVTLNKMVQNLGGLFGVAVLVDDLSKLPDRLLKDLDNMVNVLEGGSEKDRMRVRPYDRDTAKWSTTILMSSEYSILSKCDPEKEGVVGRLMELDIMPDDIFDNAEESNKLVAHYNKNYGLIADAFVYQLLSTGTLDNLSALYQEEVDKLRASHVLGNHSNDDYSKVLSRMEENVAFVTLAGKLFNQFFSFDLNTAKVADRLLKSTIDKLESFRLSQKGNIIMRTIYPNLLKYGLEVCKDINTNPDRVLITSAAMKTMLTRIQSDMGYKPIQVKSALKESGVLVANDGPYSFTATINGKSFRGTCLLNKKEDSNE